jgi:protein-tyrosine phosphatase
MFSIFKKKKKTATVDLSGIGTDMHSHLLPGIDDGSTDVDTSLQLINGLRDLGYRNLITTPHIMWDMYKNDASTIEPAKQQVQQALTATASP